MIAYAWPAIVIDPCERYSIKFVSMYYTVQYLLFTNRWTENTT